MNAYKALAVNYDRLTNDVDYEATVAFYRQILAAEGLHPRTAVDLACGTGSVTAILARMGIPTTGVDMSEEMLTVAQQKTMDLTPRPFFSCQRLERLALPRAVDLAVCALDSLDYITEPKSCREAIRRAYRALNPGGIFIFDMNTRYKYEELLGDNSFCETREDSSFIWENYYDPEEQVNQYDLTLFIKEEDDLFRRYEETHFQRAYEIETVRKLIEEAGMKWEGVFDVETGKEPTACSERIYIIAREQGK